MGFIEKFIMGGPRYCLEPTAGSDDSDLEVTPEDCKARDAESRAQAERKKAGLPELEVDQLPSTIATKMMKLIA